MDAAQTVFAEKSINLATIDDITKRADLGKGTFYYHFRNKEKLVRELIRDLMRQLADTIRSEVKGITSLEDVLDRIISTHVEFFSDRWSDYVLYFQGRADLALEEGYEGIESPFVEYLECIEEVVDSAIKRRVSSSNLRRIACAVAGFVSGYYSFALIEMKSNQIEKSMQSMRGALVAGLAEFINEAVP
jgi:AcrR family transcriptional regulator